ncbi:amino acid adenylation domain-containing protein [Streptomyces sp. NPDC002018]|uniref:amino acid adenylation domain-containing protein n=1 Tax=Streptomyces sp. NPDC002018 TaxID=3364629 RepID=UPI003675F6A0
MTLADPGLSAHLERGAEADSFPLLSARAPAPSFRRAAGELAYGCELPHLLAAFAAVLSRHNELQRVAVGVPYLRGDLVGLLTLHLDLGEEPTFATALTAAEQALEEARALTGARLRARLAQPAPACVVSVLGRPGPGPDPLGPAGLRAVRQVLAPTELHLIARPDEDRLSYEFRTDVFDAVTARRIAEQTGRAVSQGARRPQARIDTLHLAGAREQAELLALSQSVTEPVEARLEELIERQIACRADRIAVSSGAWQLTYRELGGQANWLALRLLKEGIGPGRRVGVRLERPDHLVPVLLAVLKTGASYVPIDPTAPPERQAVVAELAGIAVLVTDDTGSVTPAGTPVEVLPHRLPTAESGPAPAGSPDDAAYLLFTSGSTGRPKGVEVAHRSVVRLFTTTRDLFGFGTQDTWLNAHAITFDASVWEIYGALLHGGRVVIAPPGTARDPEAMVTLVENEGVTMLTLSPTAFDGFRDAALERGTAFPLLRYAVLCAEALNPAALAPWFERWGERTPTLVNMYGITETTVHSTFHRLSAADVRDGRSRIGTGLPDTPVYVLDRQGRPAPFGVPGEIHVGGPGVALGYAAAPDFEQARFTTDAYSAVDGARLYRSGDKGRRLPDGTIEYLGRLDQQVKIRGYRIELGEVEAALLAHPSVLSARAWVIRRPDRPPLLAAAVVLTRTGARPTPQNLRDFAAARLPRYAVPAGVVLVRELPRTPNGKLDTARLPDPFADAAGHTHPDAPGAGRPAEAQTPPTDPPALSTVTEAVAQVLGLPRISGDANFFEAGGDSITAVRLVARLRAAGFDADLPRIYRARTPRALAASLPAADLPATAGPPPDHTRPLPDGLPAGAVDAFPATRLQRGMFLHSVRDGSHVYHDVLSYTVNQHLEEDLLRGALHEAVAAHPALRSAFAVDHPSGPLQVVHGTAELACTFTDLRDRPAHERRAYLRAWAAEERRVPFDWSAPGLLRIFVHRTADRESVLSLSVHHTVLDGWSAASLVTELLLTHTRLREGLPAPVRTPDDTMRRYAELEEAAESDERHRSFWRGYLDGARPTPIPGGTPAAAPPLVEAERSLPAELTERFAAFARASGVPLKSAYLTAHLATLSFLSGETEVLTGLVTSGRLEEAGGDTGLGLFLNTVPLRAQVADRNWRELLASVFDNETGLYAHRRLPLERIQAETGSSGLVPTAFNYTDFHVYDRLAQAGIRLSDVRYDEETDFPLLAAVHEDPFGGPATLSVSHHTDQPDDELAVRYADFFEHLLHQATAAPDEPAVRTLARWAQVRGATAEPAPGPPAAACGSLVPLLAERLGTDPQALLLTAGGEEWTRGRIARRVAGLRRRLQTLGVTPATRVACFLERGPDPLVALLALWSLGAAYVPIDTGLPPARRRAVLAAAHCTLALRSQALPAEQAGWHGPELVLAGPDEDGAKHTGTTASGSGQKPPTARTEPSAGPAASGTPAGPDTWSEPAPGQEAYVLFTSGSTGEPKGVSMPHRAMANLITWQAAQPEFATPRRVSQFAPLAFDVSVQEMLTAVVHGGTLHVIPDEVRRNSQALLDFFVDQDIEVGFLPPVALHQLTAAWEAFGRTPARLTHLLLAGEALVVDDTLRAFCAAAGTELVNQYGPTETHVVTSHRLGPAPATWPDRPPIGQPIAGVRARVLDQLGRPVPRGAQGELHIAGAPVATGYLGTDGTAAPDGDRFTVTAHGASSYRTGDLVRVADGELAFAGRLDDQVKVRGHRVEPDEVAAVLLRHGGVRACSVQAVHTQGAGTELAAYVVPAGAWVTAATVQEHARTELPEYAVPRYVELLDRIPQTPSGKVDARALRAPRPIRPRPGPPTALTPSERRVLAVWATVLGRPVASPTLSFFEAGGSSLLALTLYLKLRATFEQPFVMHDLFRFPTARGFAAFLTGGSTEARQEAPSGTPGRDVNRIATAAARRRLARGREKNTGE